MTWERIPSQREQASAQKDKEESTEAPTSNIPSNNLLVWDLKTGQQVGSFLQKVYVPELWLVLILHFLTHFSGLRFASHQTKKLLQEWFPMKFIFMNVQISKTLQTD